MTETFPIATSISVPAEHTKDSYSENGITSKEAAKTAWQKVTLWAETCNITRRLALSEMPTIPNSNFTSLNNVSIN